MIKHIVIGVEVETEEDYDHAIEDLGELTSGGITGATSAWVEDAEGKPKVAGG